MIAPPTSVGVLVATMPVDFRKGMDGLAAMVQEALKADPFSGVIYVFRAKRADRVKLLFWDRIAEIDDDLVVSIVLRCGIDTSLRPD